MFCVFKMKKMVGAFLLSLGILLITVAMVINLGTEEIEVFNADSEPTYTIVIDAGHGEPDGGAVSKNGIGEAGLNL